MLGKAPVSRQAEAGAAPRGRKAKGGKKTEETTRGGALAGYRNLGRKRERAQPAHCRAAGVKLYWAEFVVSGEVLVFG